MSYQVKEIYYTLQGEGANAGRPAVFCRFSGCNLWSGRERDRAVAKCSFCDTDFVGTDGPGGGTFRSADILAREIFELWPKAATTSRSFVVFTGGEPLLQLDIQLIKAVSRLGLETAVETNGTFAVPSEIDWITVSPKPDTLIRQRSGDELKLVYPQDIEPESLVELDFRYFLLSPLVSEDKAETQNNLKQAIAYCKANPKWRLTYQYHKIWGIP